jgi:hypothetical protein
MEGGCGFFCEFGRFLIKKEDKRKEGRGEGGFLRRAESEGGGYACVVLEPVVCVCGGRGGE